MNSKSIIALLFLGLFSFTALKATHNRAGEITYERIQPFFVPGTDIPYYNYLITVIVYTDHGPNVADRCADTVYFGDGQRGVAYRVNGGTGLNCNCQGTVQCGAIIIGGSSGAYTVKKNIYTIQHVYPASGTYLIQMFDPNRNQGVQNIPNSDQQPFYLESLLVIRNVSGANTSPKFGFDPIDRACLGKCFYHDPGAYDPDGDSLSFVISTSRGAGGATVPGYSFPETSGTYGINPVTGLLSWCSPMFNAEYNVAFIVYEWRKNTSGAYEIIGFVLRDMQVVVAPCPNNDPPTVIVPADTCVEAGTFITKKIYVNDPDNEVVKLSGSGGAFSSALPKATIAPTSAIANYTATFNWQTTCDHIRQQPYQTKFKVADSYSIAQVYFATYNIRVVPPTVKNVTAVPMGSSIKITWSLSTCPSTVNPLASYKIYRRDSCGTVPFTPCQVGPPQSAGFNYIGSVGPAIAQFIDNNGGNGLVVGRSYSYLVVANYSDSTQSFASAQVCTKLIRNIPVIIKSDVLSTSATTGSIAVAWERPVTNVNNLDTNVFTGPYQFILKYRPGATGTFSNLYTSSSPYFLGLSTSYTQTNINTVDGRADYMVEFISGTVSIGSSPLATSVFLKTSPADRKIQLNWAAETPWINYKYKIWKKNPGASNFVLIDSTTQNQYLDKNNIVNKYNYCYKVTSEGEYSDPGIFKPIINNSQESCATAVDSTAPCAPTLSIEADCPSGFVKVSWNNVTALACGDDVIEYILYYKETVEGTYQAIDTTKSLSYTYDGLESISGCYAIRAIDSTYNISALSPDFCVENCPEFELPNIVTSNNDGVNDFYKAIRVRYIKEIDLKIFDRWGNLVYTTKDPYFQWNTISQFSNEPVSEGTFFYICDVFEPRLKGIVKRNLKGWMQVVR